MYLSDGHSFLSDNSNIIINYIRIVAEDYLILFTLCRRPWNTAVNLQCCWWWLCSAWYDQVKSLLDVFVLVAWTEDVSQCWHIGLQYSRVVYFWPGCHFCRVCNTHFQIHILLPPQTVEVMFSLYLFCCLVCLPVNKITQKVINQFSWNLVVS